MKFSLINVSKTAGDRVAGYWLQDHIGTLDSAKERAVATNAVNGNKLTIAVVAALASPVPMLGHFDNLTALAVV